MKFVDATEAVECRPGDLLMNAIVAPCREYFEIRLMPDGTVVYWVRAWSVSREVYLDCLATAAADMFEPPSMFDEGEAVMKPEPEAS